MGEPEEEAAPFPVVDCETDDFCSIRLADREFVRSVRRAPFHEGACLPGATHYTE